MKTNTYALDTHALVFWLMDDSKLSAKARKILRDPGNRFCISTACILEIQYLIENGRIETEIGEVLSYIQREHAFFLQPFDELVLLETLGVSEHRDLFGRIILGTAKAYNLPIITRNQWMKSQYKKASW